VELRVDGSNILNAEWFDGELVYASDYGGGAGSQIPQRHVTVGAPPSVLASLALHL